MHQPLIGIKVIDLSRVLAGPYCTMILGDLGAEVIKVEKPGGSDDTRAWGPPEAGGESAYYLCSNRNKRALSLNLQAEEGRDILRHIVQDADVLMHNFKTGTMEKWGLSYEQLHQLNPGLVFCSISGFGETGPNKGMPGYDAMIQAMGGLMSITGSKESGPMKVGVAIADLAAGLYAVIGILSSLFERVQSGLGQQIDIALLDAQLSLLANVASNFLISGDIPERHGNQHPNIVPYQTFETADGEIMIAVGNDHQFQKLCELIHAPQLFQDHRFSSNSQRLVHREELISKLSGLLKSCPMDQLQSKLKEAGIPHGPIRNLEQVFNDPQVGARQMLHNMSHPTAGSIPLVGSPLKLSRSPVSIRRHPPLAGEHTLELMREYGFTDEQITSLMDKGII